MAFTKRHFNVKPNIAKVTCMKKSPLLKESSDVDMREENWVTFLTQPKLKMTTLYVQHQ